MIAVEENIDCAIEPSVRSNPNLLFYIAHRDKTEQHSGQESQALRI